MTVAFSLRSPRTAAQRAEAEIEVEEHYWGYIIRAASRTADALWAARALAWLVATSSLLAAAGMWILPAEIFPRDAGLGRLGATGLLVGFSGVLLWLTTTSVSPEMQVDLKLAEVREVVRGADGQPRLVGRTAFADIGGVYLDRRGLRHGSARLKLRWRNTVQSLELAAGSEAQLAGLRDRVGRDIAQYHV